MPLRALRLAAVALSLSLILTAGAAQAGDDDDEMPQDQGFIKSLMKGIGGQSMDDSSINYRERSPLVVPSKTDLPPPASKKIKPAANWPKDPDEQARREAIAASKQGPEDPIAQQRPLMPSELAARPPKKRTQTTTEDVTPGGMPANPNPMLSPSELGFNNSMFSNVFGGNKPEVAQFKSEPARDSLTMPPAGYQTPSPNYAYGSGPIKSETKEQYNPVTDKGEIGR
jgi:hypothetical protein